MKKRTWMKYIAGCLTLALFVTMVPVQAAANTEKGRSRYVGGCYRRCCFDCDADPNGNSKRDSDCNSYSESGII